MLKILIKVTEIIGLIQAGAVYSKAPSSGAEMQDFCILIRYSRSQL